MFWYIVWTSERSYERPIHYARKSDSTIRYSNMVDCSWLIRNLLSKPKWSFFYGLPLDIIVWIKSTFTCHMEAPNFNNQCMCWMEVEQKKNRFKRFNVRIRRICDAIYMIEHPESIQFHHHINLNTQATSQIKRMSVKSWPHSFYVIRLLPVWKKKKSETTWRTLETNKKVKFRVNFTFLSLSFANIEIKANDLFSLFR